MTRTDNVKRNLIFNIIKFVTHTLLQFVLRTALIYIMGAEYLGLNGLFTNIFAFLNLAELGIGSAIVFSMYKPIAEGDTEKVKSLQQLYKKFYLIITLVVLTLGMSILPFIKFFIKGEVAGDINIYLLYILYLVNTLVGYLSAHKRSLLFAYQRNDVENKIKTLCIIGMTITQIVVLFIFKNYYIYFTVSIIFTIIESILIYFSSKKLFPNIKGKSEKLDKETTSAITKNVAALSFHKIGGIIVTSTDNILISSILGLVVLGAYSNYYLVITSLIAVFSLFSSSLLGSFGNLIASSTKDYVYEKYKQINFMFSLLSAFTSICLFVLFQPFIKLWTGGGIYLLGFSSVLLLSFNFYINRMRTSTIIVKESAGLFKQDKWRPIIESIINLVLSIVLAYFIGLNGIILGTIISSFAPIISEPFVVYKHYFKKNVWHYFKRFILDTIITLAVGTICYVVCSFIPDGGIWLLVAKFATCIILSASLLIITYSPTKEFRETWKLCIDFCKNIFHKNK